VRDGGVHAVVEALYVHVEYAIEVSFRRFLEIRDLRDTGIIDEDVDRPGAHEMFKRLGDCGVIRNVALVRLRVAACRRDSLFGALTGFAVHVQNADSRAGPSEELGDCFADAAAASGDDGRFSIQSKRRLLRGSGGQSETPLFQGMKSSCASNSARVKTSPLAI
jgi:hypothetical protein